jgi:hypothetical protein
MARREVGEVGGGTRSAPVPGRSGPRSAWCGRLSVGGALMPSTLLRPGTGALRRLRATSPLRWPFSRSSHPLLITPARRGDLTLPPQSIGARVVPSRRGWKTEWRFGSVGEPPVWRGCCGRGPSALRGQCQMRPPRSHQPPEEVRKSSARRPAHLRCREPAMKRKGPADRSQPGVKAKGWYAISVAAQRTWPERPDCWSR